MLGKMIELVGFFSKDFAQFWAQKGLQSTLLVTDFYAVQRFSTPGGIGLDISFTLENKLQSLNAVSSVTFSVDGVCVPFSWVGDAPGAMPPLERAHYRAHTGAIPVKGGGLHQCRLEVVDGAGRAHMSACGLAVASRT